MREPNAFGVYEAEITEELARQGRSFAAIDMCECEDGLFRYALHVHYSSGGFAGPISKQGIGYATLGAARCAAVEDLLKRLPNPSANGPQNIQSELKAMRDDIDKSFQQPGLF